MSRRHVENNKNNNIPSSQPNLLFYMEGCKTCNFFITTAHKANILRNFKMICIDGQKDKFKAQGLKKVPTIIIPSINKQFDGSDCLKWLEDIIKSSSRNNNFGMQNEELIIPDIGIVSNQPNQPNQQMHSNHSNKNIFPPNPPNQPNSMNNHVSNLTNKISQLSTQLNNNQMNQQNSNQFAVPNTNIIKRNTLNPVQPPLNKNNGNKNGVNIKQMPNTNNQNSSQTQPTVKPINQLFGYLQNEMSGFSDGYAYISVDNPLPKSFLPPDKDMEIYTAPEGDKINKKKQEQMMQLAEMERTNEKEQMKNTIDEMNRRIAMGEHNLMPKWVGTNKDL
jgi:hypothetical protein